ncbi:double-strand break repair helicase AddA [Pseudoruegeria sp. HB172150]|uniref:double-strand break repair helicase AddA n=1 Tax=Pseudoruegeria sp. HB172150 TaxID=2721164 RepID=UPI0015528AC3|nr:double-strand break repair helicase AddA [Pseudoruegeria sp. HB172150]
MKLDAATISQNRAAEPGNSTWLSANAGSGKTRVLTDRVARLLLDKVPPQNILCLTYTKAAASEMQNRLFRRLGDWAMKPDGALAEELQRMGETEVFAPERLAEARRLFARAIETPGGLRIQTIHSFCSSLLRRFPLEARVSPAFVEMDDRAADRLREQVVEDLASGPHVAAIDAVAAQFTGEDLGALSAAVVGARAQFAGEIEVAEVLGWFGQPAELSLSRILAEAFDGSEAALVKMLVPVLQQSSKVTDARTAEKLEGLNWSDPGIAELETAISTFLTGAGANEPFSAKTGKLPTKDCRQALGALADELDDLMLRVADARPKLVALRAAEKTAALHQFAEAFLPAYERRKQLHGWLDFDDLILKTLELLSDPAVADWVLYRLDGGLDHILVDEAQDTSPVQWQVIQRLAQEFTSGRGARDDRVRTIFVVGDKKQSIYSFQGADPEEFDRMRDHFRERLEWVGQALQRRELEYSFRSSDAILRLVDTIFGDIPEARLDMDTWHRAFRDELPGRVDLWPVVAPAEKQDKLPWYEPMDRMGEDHHEVRLAREIAGHIARTIGTETIPTPDGTRRKVRAGDFLILVRRRSGLFAEIIRACKAAGMPVAGADRLKLGGELAVKDLAAVLSFLATPEDDLSLAAALRSPLFGWTEAQLYQLAAGREETYLWTALRKRTDCPETLAILDDLRKQADFLRPYDLIERILSRHDGRRRLLAQLGAEAEDGIDSLLNQALSYERMDVPSLTGFLTWLETDDVEVKRQMDNAGDQIRVMTVHGAKGLESPIVILPDTAKRQLRMRDEIVIGEDGAPMWKTPSGWQPDEMVRALDSQRAAQEAEALRLYYVAITRAETWLIVAAAGDTGNSGESWHDLARQGLERLGALPLDTPVGEGLRYAHLDWDAGPLEDVHFTEPPDVELPEWITTHLSLPPKLQILSPSDLGGAKALGMEGEEFDLDASLRRGRQVHLLLEHLPGVPAERWNSVAASLLAQGKDAAEGSELESLIAEARGVLIAPDLDWLFAPDVLSEVDVSAALTETGLRIHGTIDKLIVSDTQVLAVDFKTNRIVPNRAEDVPDGILRQMAAYEDALRQIFPDRAVESAILWTNVPRLMRLPHEIVRAAMHMTTTS